MKYTFFTFASAQLRPIPPVIKKDLTGKTAVVVGANSGIGYETAKHFALMGVGRLVLACRSQERGEAALKRLEEETSFKAAEVRLIDLASFVSVKDFVTGFEKDSDARLDFLVLNAAILAQPDNPRTKDGWEASFQTNNLSTSLLTVLFLPLLNSTAKTYGTTPRIIILTSGTHYLTKLDKSMVESENPLRVFDSKEYFDPETAEPFGTQRVRYNDTKLLNVFFTRSLATRMPNNHSHPTIITCAVNPGFSYSAGLQPGSGNPILRALFSVLQWIFARSQEQAARQVIWGALAEEPGINGSYVSETAVTEPSDYVISNEGKAAEDKLWNNLVEELAKVDPKIQEIVDRYLTTPVPH